MSFSANALYLCDNGRCVCGTHLGSTAKATGWDVSGQEIYEIQPSDHEVGTAPFKCEVCAATLARSAKHGTLRAVFVRPLSNGKSAVYDYAS